METKLLEDIGFSPELIEAIKQNMDKVDDFNFIPNVIEETKTEIFDSSGQMVLSISNSSSGRILVS